MFKTILFACDGSEAAAKAFETALELARKEQASLYLLAVSHIPEFSEDVETEAILENSKAYYTNLLTPLAQRATEAGIAASVEVAAGHPAEQIIYHAEQRQADLIVMGHRGKSFFKRWLLGSVTKRVVSYAPCSVLVVR